MYTNGDYPFKVGKLMGTDAGGNRYYENTIDFPFGQHRWVEPGDIHNYDPSSIPPEWHGWMHSMSDAPGNCDAELEARKGEIKKTLNHSDAIYDHGVGFQNPPPPNPLNHMHNLSQLRARGPGVGNSVFGLPPDAPDLYYTQPGSPYSKAGKKGRFGDGEGKKETLESLRAKAQAALKGEYTTDDPHRIIRSFDKSDNSRPDRLGPVGTAPPPGKWPRAAGE
ncbi:hypothetical protein TeGR_g1501 [Tetraparma gracilis]|nr:hypothetical protein TeGR_g1501 [Tetraparma gracilis]